MDPVAVALRALFGVGLLRPPNLKLQVMGFFERGRATGGLRGPRPAPAAVCGGGKQRRVGRPSPKLKHLALPPFPCEPPFQPPRIQRPPAIAVWWVVMLSYLLVTGGIVYDVIVEVREEMLTGGQMLLGAGPISDTRSLPAPAPSIPALHRSPLAWGRPRTPRRVSVGGIVSSVRRVPALCCLRLFGTRRKPLSQHTQGRTSRRPSCLTA